MNAPASSGFRFMWLQSVRRAMLAHDVCERERRSLLIYLFFLACKAMTGSYIVDASTGISKNNAIHSQF